VRLSTGDGLDMALIRLPFSMKLAALGLTAVLLGCSESGDPVVVAPVTEAVAPAPLAREQAPTPQAGDAEAPLVPTGLTENSGASAHDETTTTAEQVEENPAAASYVPPFPDRVDLFVPPKRQGGVVLKEGGTEDAVELLGFIRLDKQQVVLSVNGQLTRIAEGDTQYGIEVISIQPPKVVLQRGRQRWQASLEK
jgi:hypothetical protein